MAVAQKRVLHRDELGRFCTPPKGRDGIRGKDRKKYANWQDLEVMHTFEDGVFIGNVTHPADLTLLGRFGGGCSGSHVWNIKNGYEYIMAVFDTDGVAHHVMHMLALDVAWVDIPATPSEKRVYNNISYCGSLGSSYTPRTWFKGEGRNRDDTDSVEGCKRAIRDAEFNLEDCIEGYEAVKKKALEWGPIGPGNPYKYDMDYYNRYKGTYTQKIKDLKVKLESLKQAEGNKPERVVCSVLYRCPVIKERPYKIITGGTQDTWGEYASEWLDTLPSAWDVPIKHVSLPEAQQFKDVTELQTAVKKSGDPRVAWLVRDAAYYR